LKDAIEREKSLQKGEDKRAQARRHLLPFLLVLGANEMKISFAKEFAIKPKAGVLPQRLKATNSKDLLTSAEGRNMIVLIVSLIEEF